MIRLAEGYAARDAAAEPARARIDADIERADPALRPALRYLRESLFDPELNVSTFQKATKNENARFFEAFREATGESPRNYIESLRLRTAASLLQRTQLRIGEIASLTGYAELRTFRLSFRRTFGVPPGAYRARAPAQDRSGAECDALAVEAPRWLAMFEAWKEAEQYDLARDSLPKQGLAVCRRSRAELAWNVASRLSEPARAELVRLVGGSTPELSQHLFVRSRIEGRGNRRWGIEVAKLALEAIPPHPNQAWSAESLEEARILAHAWLGNGFRLDLDFAAAAASFEKVTTLLAQQSRPVSPATLSEVFGLHAALFWFQSQFASATRLATRAVETAHAARESEKLLLALRWRAAIRASAGQTEQSVHDLNACIELLGGRPRRAEALPIYHALAERHVELGQADEAENALAIAGDLAAEAPDSRLEAQFELTRGRLARLRGDLGPAASHIQAALRGFEAHDSRYDIVVAMTDLCLVRLERGETAAAIEIARQLLPALRLIHADDRWRGLIAALQAGVAEETLRIALMARIREVLPSLVIESIGLRCSPDDS